MGQWEPLQSATVAATAAPTSSSVPVPVQRNGFRYLPAERQPWVTEDAYRRAISPVALSRYDRSAAVTLAEGHLSATGSSVGYRSVAATESVLTGDWYFELVWTGGEASALRFGVALVGAEMCGPLGFDAFGWAWCSSGHLYHSGEKTACAAGFGRDSVLGCRIRLPSLAPEDETRILTNPPRRKAVSYFGTYLEESLPKKSTSGAPPGGGRIDFYRDGRPTGVSFAGLPIGSMYYPTISLYRDATVHINFGPEFVSPPTAASGAEPFCSVVRKSVVASALAELKDLQAYNKP